MKKIIFILLLFILASCLINASQISGNPDFWKMEDFLGFDSVGDCKTKIGDISSAFAKIEEETIFLRITFDDMVKRQENNLISDNFADTNIHIEISAENISKEKVVEKKLDLSLLHKKTDKYYSLRTPKYNLFEVSFPDINIFEYQNLTFRFRIFINGKKVDEYSANSSKSYRGGNAAFVHHGNQGLTYTEVFYGQYPPETSGFDEVLEVHQATNIPGNFHMSGTLMPAAEWHNPEFNDWLEQGASEGWVAMLSSALGQQIMPFVQNDMNNWSVNIECDMVDYLYDYVPKVAWIPERVWLKPDQYPNAGVIDWLGDNWTQYGIDAVILDDNPHCWDVSSTKIHWMNNGSGINLRIIPINNSFVGNMHYDADAAKNQINSTGQYDLVVYGTDWEVAAEMNEHHNTMFLENYENVLWYCYDNYPAINVWKLDSAMDNPDFNGTNFAITPGTYGLLGGGDGYGGSDNSWYIDWAACPSHSDFHDPQWNYGYIWNNAYENIMSAPDNRLSQIAWYILMINLHETGWHSEGQIAGWEHRYSSHMKNANVYAEAARWANGNYTQTTNAFYSDIDRDGIEELIIHNDKLFCVFEEIGGKINWAMIKDENNLPRSIIGSDMAYWSETEGDYNEGSNNHVAGLSDVSPNYQNLIYEMSIDTVASDSLHISLTKNNLNKTVSLETGDSFLDVIYNFGNEMGYIESGWTPNVLDLIWNGKNNLQRMWGDGGEYCGQRNSSSGATVAYVTGDAGAEFSSQFEGTLVMGDEIKGDGNFEFYLYGGYTSEPYDPNINKVAELDSLAENLADDISPRVYNGASYKVGENKIEIIYDEIVEEESAENPSNYEFNNFSQNYTIQDIDLNHTRKATITTNETIPQAETGEIVVTNVQDLSGNVINPNYNTAVLEEVVMPHVVGNMNDWNPANHDFDLILGDNGVWTCEMELPPDTYSYKIVESNDWDENDFPAENQTFTLNGEETVTFFTNCGLLIGSRSWDEFVFHSPNPPVVVGDFLSEIGGTDWNEETTLTIMNDSGNNGDEIAFDGIYTFQTELPASEFEYKIVLNNNWEQNTTNSNLFLDLEQESQVKFYYDMAENLVDKQVYNLSVESPVQVIPSAQITNIFPNPSRKNININFSINKELDLEIKVFNIKGKLVKKFARQEFQPGEHIVEWNCKTENNLKISNGIYLIKLLTNENIDLKKCLYLQN